MSVRRLLAAIAAAFVATNLTDVVTQAFLLAGYYARHADVFVTDVNHGVAMACELLHVLLLVGLYLKTRPVWAPGVKGAVACAVALQAFLSLPAFLYNPLFLKGYPAEAAAYWILAQLAMGVLQGLALGLVAPRVTDRPRRSNQEILASAPR